MNSIYDQATGPEPEPPAADRAEATEDSAAATGADTGADTATDTAAGTAADTAGRDKWWWVPGASTVVVILGVIVVTLWQLHPSLLFTNTTTTGGDTGAHVALPAYLETLLKHGHIAGWDPSWYDGYSLYTFYFAIPDLFAAVAGWIIPYNIAFKLITVLGSVLLPICAWACGRLFRLRPPIPAILAALTLPFLFDYTYTIYGGNLFSTLAGEYAYSFSLSMALLFLGLFSRVVRGGTCRGWAAIVLALCVLSHIIPGMLALAGAAILVVVELLPTSWRFSDAEIKPFWDWDPVEATRDRWGMLWRAGSTVAIGLLLSGWWLVPFGLSQSYATSMGYTNVTTYLGLFLPEADAWALVIAFIAVVLTIVLKSRFGLVFSVLGFAAALGLRFDPQGKLYNVRLLPLWFICVYLMAGWAIGVGVIVVARWWRRSEKTRWQAAQFRQAASGVAGPELDEDPDAAVPGPLPAGSHRAPPGWRWSPGAAFGSLIAFIAILAIVVPPFIFPAGDLPVTVGANMVKNWSSYNYSGYQRLPSYDEYHAVINTMAEVGKDHGCGRAMWEYNADENRFGTPESLMLLPYWTKGCIDSMEGLLFESSATTPYHFVNQAELSAVPSDPDATITKYYGPLDVTLGVKHLQLLGVKYFMAESAQVEAQANADPDLKLIATSGPWANGAAKDHLERLRGQGRAARPTAGQRAGRRQGHQGNAVELALPLAQLVRGPREVEGGTGPERTELVAPCGHRGGPPRGQGRAQDHGVEHRDHQ